MSLPDAPLLMVHSLHHLFKTRDLPSGEGVLTGSCETFLGLASSNRRDCVTGRKFSFLGNVFGLEVKILQSSRPTSQYIGCILHVIERYTNSR